MNYEIRKVEKRDYPSLFKIEEVSFLSPWTNEEFISEITNNPYANVYVLEVFDSCHNAIVGFYDYWVTFDSATIAQIAILPSFRRHGYASIMLKEILDDCYAKHVSNITLEVREHNIAAIKLYEKFGFKVETIKEHYYTNGDNALYMVKKVNLNG